MKLILGSKSASRRLILKSLGYQFEVMDPNIDEKAIRDPDPSKLTLTLANAKADALLPLINDPAILITSDQIVLCDNKIYEKPRDVDEARHFLQSYLEHPAETITAVVLTNTLSKERRYGIDLAKIWFKPIPKDIIEKLIIEDDIYSRAGGFSIEHPLLNDYIATISGTPDSIMGLPITLTIQLINQIHQSPGGTAG